MLYLKDTSHKCVYSRHRLIIVKYSRSICFSFSDWVWLFRCTMTAPCWWTLYTAAHPIYLLLCQFDAKQRRNITRLMRYNQSEQPSPSARIKLTLKLYSGPFSQCSLYPDVTLNAVRQRSPTPELIFQPGGKKRKEQRPHAALHSGL